MVPYLFTLKLVNYVYYFVESEGNPSTDPILLWITGGPGCSSLHGFLYENGPLLFKYGEWDGEIPKLFYNPYAWSKNFSIIYLDGPVGTGFSYSTTEEGGKSSDTLFAHRTYEFLIKWLEQYPEFKNNPVYIGGDGYSGVPIPLVIQNILDGIIEAPINLKGYMLGSPGTDRFLDFNTRAYLAHNFGYIPDELFQRANESSNGNFTSIWLGEVTNGPLAEIKALVSNINTAFVLDASCCSLELSLDTYQPTPFPNTTAIYFSVWCRKEFDFYYEVWVNNVRVKEALQVDQTGLEMLRPSCGMLDDSIYNKDVSSVVSYHKSFATNSNLRALIYSGDHDMDVPYIGTEFWIEALNMPLVDKWRVWSVDNETAGFTRSFQNDDFNLTFTTVKGAGHFAPQYKIKECAAMISRWIGGDQL